MMKIVLNQFNAVWENADANLEKLKHQWSQIVDLHGDLLVLPEMFNSGFSMSAHQIAEPLDGPTLSFLQTHAKQTRLPILAGLALKREGNCVSNSAVLVNSAGTVAAIYDKMQPFTFAGERDHYLAGTKPCVFEVAGGRFGVFVCYDLRFPELFRMVAKQVEAIIVIANWPSPRLEHWTTLLKARAIENQCYVIGVNRTGSDANNLDYPNSSVVFDSLGKNVPVHWASNEIGVAELDFSTVEKTRTSLPFLKDFAGL